MARLPQKDLENLDLLLLMIGSITPEHDRKLQQLITDLRGKFACPINAGNRKVIIFTAFSDTAEYLYGCLAAPILESMGCIRHSSPETWKHAVHCAFHNARSSTSIRCFALLSNFKGEVCHLSAHTGGDRRAYRYRLHQRGTELAGL